MNTATNKKLIVTKNCGVLPVVNIEVPPCPQSECQSPFWGLRPQTPASEEILIFSVDCFGFASSTPEKNTDAILHSRNRIFDNVLTRLLQGFNSLLTTFLQRFNTLKHCQKVVRRLLKPC